MITEPTMLLDETRCRRNIDKMVSKFSDKHIQFRPHFKTHQSIEIGTWFKDYGVNKITVSSLKMASYFSDEWDDITVAFPVNLLEINTINRLSQKITLNLLVESPEAVEYLERNLNHNVGIFIKIDTGYGRTGLAPTKIQKIEAILGKISSAQFLTFMGFLSHAGHTYNCRTEADIININETSLKILKDLKKRFIKDYPNCIISLGDTPGCSVAENFEGVDEVRPGNFVFYDLTQHLIGSNSMDEIAVAVACPIVAIHEDKHKIIVFGGGVHFSKERLEDPELGVIYGQVVRHEGLKWTKPIPNMYVSALSQEHGTIHVPEAEILNYRIGDYLVVLPVHSCMTANLMNSYLNVNINRPIFHM